MSTSALLSPPLEGHVDRGAPLGEQLMHAGLLAPHELEAALTQQKSKGSRLGEVLSEMGFVDEEDLLPFIGIQLGIPAVRLREGLVDPAVVQIIPRAKAERLHAIALFCVRDELTVALAEPQNLQIIDEIERITGKRVRPVVALRSAIEKLIPRCY
ncbi:MAG: hypothetical protein KDA93_11330, partial [Planctomycetaceae bacterium]|nr:hypothetical protein [Planctomycetaceae bacterium]